MQKVFRARDLILKRDVALKVPKNTSAARRFKRSAVLSSKVSHPNAAKTLDYLEIGASSYLIEEFIEGEDLWKVRERLPLMDPCLVAHLMHHIARGAAASHHVSVVHRDLKPSNIMVSPNLSFAAVKITDFGIAKMAQEEIAAAAEGGEESITGSHTMMGALPYMSPEMIKSPRTTDTPSDVWAIASIGYELLTGDKPFGKGLAAVPNIVGRVLPSLPAHLGKSQFRDLGNELFGVMTMCWIADPAQRPSADELVTMCGRLCYLLGDRREGVVQRMPYPTYGFVASTEGNAFFHTDSVYGPTPAPGDRIYFAAFPGRPVPRAHPVVRMVSPTGTEG
jgi:serine/threonine protein kinase